MDFRYRWKHGAPPNRDQAAQDGNLLNDSQFETPQDQQLAEEMARKHLNVPCFQSPSAVQPGSSGGSDDRLELGLVYSHSGRKSAGATGQKNHLEADYRLGSELVRAR